MNFIPKTPEQIAKEKAANASKFLLPDGEYDFEAVGAEPATSKKTGGAMIKLRLKVYGNDGSERFVTDYLVPSMEHKLYHFAWGTGMGEKYDAGGFEAEDCVGRMGRVKIKIEKNDTYGDKNVVRDYVVVKPAQKSEQIAPELQEEDTSGLPF